MKMTSKHSKKNIFYIIGIGVLLLCLIGLSTGMVLAKYISQKDATVPYTTPAFYFESDLLTGETHTLGKGTTEITFKLRNYADETRFADTDIEYTVTVTKPDSTTETKTGTITGGAANAADISFTGLTSGSYTVTANSTKPYLKTLTATFVIPELNNTITADLTDDGIAVKVKVKTVDYSGDIVLVYPANLSPDNTDDLMSSAGTGSYTVEDFNNDSEHTFVFFKTDTTKTYTVSVTGTTVTIAEVNS